MPNDFSSLWSFPRRSARILEETHQLCARVRWAAFAIFACAALTSCGGESDDEITYEDDIRPIFNRRCTTCHYSSTPIGVDIQNPFAPERGLVNAPNSWAAPEAYPGRTDDLNVVPFQPENSFLIDKLTGELPEGGEGGSPMPFQVPPLDGDEIATLEQWITDGAEDNQFFQQNVRPIFGSESSAGAYYGGKCIFCHYTGSPNPLDLSNPFGPNGLVNGGVGVDATYVGDMLRVQPGSPEDSLLILKVRAVRPESEIGAQMPYSFVNLSTSQIDLVRRWIAEGARP